MKKVELLAPAGDLEKLKIAVIYGADAVYIGGKKFSLRARASNFSIDDVKEGVNLSEQDMLVFFYEDIWTLKNKLLMLLVIESQDN